MHACWLIDSEMFGDAYRQDLVRSIESQGHEVKLIRVPQPPYRWDNEGCSYRETFSADSCVIAHGDIELVTRIRDERRWRPGAFCSVENYFCSRYYCWFGSYLLNDDYMMLPYAELSRCRDFLFDKIGRGDRIFVRPDSPLKLFTGQVATRETFAADLELMGFYEFPGDSLVVVSSPKEIVCEWRFVVAEGKIVASSLYRDSSDSATAQGVDKSALEFATELAVGGYQPDPVWILDICKTADGSYRLLEVGGFSFSDLYACDKGAIVEAVSAAALKVWSRPD